MSKLLSQQDDLDTNLSRHAMGLVAAMIGLDNAVLNLQISLGSLEIEGTEQPDLLKVQRAFEAIQEVRDDITHLQSILTTEIETLQEYGEKRASEEAQKAKEAFEALFNKVDVNLKPGETCPKCGEVHIPIEDGEDPFDSSVELDPIEDEEEEVEEPDEVGMGI